MRALKELVRRMAGIRAFLELSDKKVEAVKAIRSGGGPDEAKEYADRIASFPEARTYDYVCSIILIYGAYETCIEEIMTWYVAGLSRVFEKYSEFPEAFRKAHFSGTLRLLERTQDKRYAGADQAIDVAKALVNCLEDTDEFDIAEGALVPHSNNFWRWYVDEYFKAVGVTNITNRAARHPAVQQFFEELGEPITIPSSSPGAIFEDIDNLVQRRNQVAHGDISDALANNVIGSLLTRVHAYCFGIYMVLGDEIVSHAITREDLSVGNPIAVYNNNIVCFWSCGLRVANGTVLALRDANGSVRHEVVQNIQIDGKDVEYVELGKDVAIGVRIRGRAKENEVVHVLGDNLEGVM